MLDNRRPLIFISNDDGIDAGGIHALIDFVKDFGDIYVVAPLQQQSGKSSSITVEVPLRVKQYADYKGAKMYSVNGTPVDCAKLALNRLLPRRPDLVIAGINHGANSGTCTIYSGTMGVVFEGCMQGLTSVGFSYLSHRLDADFSSCEELIKKIVGSLLNDKLPQGVCLNVNIPADCKIKGVKAAVSAKGHWTEEFVEHKDPFGNPCYWLTGQYQNEEPDNSETDLYLLDRGYATIVPCRPDQTLQSEVQMVEQRFGIEF
ncbi:MAG: 5'/3'-nucleotidase SurE [Muribaculaceae bacterium]|nr:5'/3'-nucleotidase SurE [Muribaculaceae bacterium]